MLFLSYACVSVSGVLFSIGVCVCDLLIFFQENRTYWLGYLPTDTRLWRDERRVPDPMPPRVPPTTTYLAAVGVLQQVPYI